MGLDHDLLAEEEEGEEGEGEGEGDNAIDEDKGSAEPPPS